MSLDFGDQYLQVARALDPVRGRLPPDTDTNDLKTINVYTVGVLQQSYSPIFIQSVFHMNLEMTHRDGPSTCIDLVDALGIY